MDDQARNGLTQLWQAFRFAGDAGAPIWDFALEIDILFQTGLTITDLRWLVSKRFCLCGLENSVYGASHRSFDPGEGFAFDKKTCVVLTLEGSAFAELFLQAASGSWPSTPFVSNASPTRGALAALENPAPGAGDPTASDQSRFAASISKPSWSATRRELSFDQALVKRFRVPAHNQELILGAFEEECWPRDIDDPLPIRRNIDPHTRLRDTINSLNGHQIHSLLRFRGNGGGTGVAWELHRSAASL